MASVSSVSRQVARSSARTSLLSMRLLAVLGVLALIFLLVNWVYQVVRKPTELLLPVSRTFTKSPAQTWQRYAASFRKYQTPVVSPPLLAALAQVEASGNPWVLTYWRWSWLALAHPFEIYKPASSAVGMYQMTNGTFEEARHYCVIDHVVIHETADGEERRCHSYNRLSAENAVELTAAYLDVHVAAIVGRLHRMHPSLRQKQDLAAIVHLCGPAAAESYARRGFRFSGEPCGDHDPRVYLGRVNAMKAVFVRMAVADGMDPEPPVKERTHTPSKLSAKAAGHRSAHSKSAHSKMEAHAVPGADSKPQGSAASVQARDVAVPVHATRIASAHPSVEAAPVREAVPVTRPAAAPGAPPATSGAQQSSQRNPVNPPVNPPPANPQANPPLNQANPQASPPKVQASQPLD